MGKRQQLRIEVLQGFRVTEDGEPVQLEANTEAILHALALSGEDGLSRDELIDVLPEPRKPRLYPMQAVKTSLGQLWGKKKKGALELPISKRTDRVLLPRGSERFSVDLWDFFTFAEEKWYREARKLIDPRVPLMLPRSETAKADLWKETLDKYDCVRSEVLEAIEARSGQVGSLLELRKQLLKRSLVYWSDPPLPIGKLRERVEAIEIPWRALQPEPLESQDGSRGQTLQEFLVAGLGAGDRADSNRKLVVADPGRGKTQTAIGIFLLLTDHLEDGSGDLEYPPIVLVDAFRDGKDPNFGTDAWLDRRLRGTDQTTRPIVIMAHAETFFANVKAKPEDMLGWRLFRECDVLLGCTERFYLQNLKYAIYPTHVAKLEPWPAGVQSEYAAALWEGEGEADLVSWRDADETALRRDLCTVPLQLTYLLPLIRAGSESREKISMRWHLLDQLAHERLRASHLSGSVDMYFDELAAIAHRFYVADRDPDEAVGFNKVDLKDFLASRNPSDVASRCDTILNDTLITPPHGVSDEDRFEHPAWGWFFTAYHIANTLKLSNPPEPPLPAFDKQFSPWVMDICKEMLLEWMPSHGETIQRSIRDSLVVDAEPAMLSAQRGTARQQLKELGEVVIGRP